MYSVEWQSGRVPVRYSVLGRVLPCDVYSVDGHSDRKSRPRKSTRRPLPRTRGKRFEAKSTFLLKHFHASQGRIAPLNHTTMATVASQASARPSAQNRSGGQRLRYEPPEFPMTVIAQREIAHPGNIHGLMKLKEHIREAQMALTTSASDINENLAEAERLLQQRKKRDGNEETEIEEAQKEVDELRGRVDNMTGRMEKGVRKLIDGEHSVEHTKTALAAAADDARAKASTQASTQPSTHQGRSQNPGRGTTGGVEGEDDDQDAEYPDFMPTDPGQDNQVAKAPIEVFRETLEHQKTVYQSRSLTDRYADNNRYREFKQMVHEMRHPDQEAPHQSEWFNEGVLPKPGLTNRGRPADGEDSDDDIAVMKATISTKCPLTLQEFNKPLTSRKCQHSYEADAILNMIAITESTPAESGRRGQRKVAQCPVPGCSHTLTKNDLEKDAVVLRKIQRIQKAKQIQQERAEEEDQKGDKDDDSVDSIDDVDDDDDDDDDVVPATQPGRISSQGQRGSAMATKSESSEDEADEDDEMEE